MYQVVISNSATDWTGTWLVVDEHYKTISKHPGREYAEQEAERLNTETEEETMYNLVELIEALNVGDYGNDFSDYVNSDGYVCDTISEIADSNTSIYYSDIMDFIRENPDSLADVVAEGLYDPSNDYDLYKHGQAAEYMTIEHDLYSNLADCLTLHAYQYCRKVLELETIPEELDSLICDMAGAEDNNARLDEIPAAIDRWIEENEQES